MQPASRTVLADLSQDSPSETYSINPMDRGIMVQGVGAKYDYLARGGV